MVIDVEPRPTDDEWELAIDSQVAEFTQLRQRLTYFLISSSTAIIAFVAAFYLQHIQGQPRYASEHLHPLLLVASAAAAGACSLCSLTNLFSSHRSYQLHLKYRYERKTWKSLTEEEQNGFKRWNVVSTTAVVLALALLLVEVVLVGVFFFPVTTIN